MHARKMSEASWLLFCAILASDIVSHKIYKNNDYPMCFQNVIDFEGYTVAQKVKIGSSDIVPKAT